MEKTPTRNPTVKALFIIIIIRLHRMHAMHETQPTVTDVHGACPTVCLSRGSTRLHSAKSA